MAAAAPARMRQTLNLREHQVALCLCVSMSDDQIAETLGICRASVHVYLNRVKAKRGMVGYSRTEMALNLNAAVKHAYFHPVFDNDGTREGSD